MKNKRQIYILVLGCIFLLSITNIRAAGEYRPVGSRAMVPGLGGVSSISLYAPISNQAAMGFASSSSVSAFYSYTGIAEGVNNFSAMGQLKLKKSGTLGFSTSYFGYELFNDKKFGLGYGLKLADFVSIGAQLDFFHSKISGYGSNSAVTFELGTLFKINKHIQLGVHVYNPARVKYGRETDERIPTVFRLGGTYTTSEKVWVNAEIEQDLDMNLAFRAGVDYRINDYFIVRGGMLTYPLSGSLGAGVSVKGLHIEVLGSYQKVTGISPQLGLSYVF
ncbi:MAG: hypothetical protein M9887_09470 [Chitinophagales bacterium]|nr:hypothetical protein [Chitinophagales bacterium]